MVPKTPQGALLAATTYLLSNVPAPGDPKEAVHRTTVASLGLIGRALDEVATPAAQPRVEPPQTRTSPPRRDSSPRHRDRADYDARNDLTQRRVDRFRARRRSRGSTDEDDDDEEGDIEACGAECFRRRIHRTQMPQGFKLPAETPKYDGTQEPRTWLDDYLAAVRCHGGSKTTAMQCLQLQLKGPARTWLKSLHPSESACAPMCGFGN